MPDRITIQKIAELTEKIGKLPKGYISKKTVNGNVYFYHQWSEGGVKKSKYLRDEEIAGLTEQIELRKKLQKELAEIKAGNISAPETQNGFLKCTLMHKRAPVIELNLDNETGFIQKIGDVFVPEHLLNRTYVRARIEQMRRETVSERVRRNARVYSRVANVAV